MKNKSLAFITLALLAGCAVPEASTDNAYHEQEVVTGSRVPRKTPANVEAVNGESVRDRGGVAPATGMARPRGSDR